MRYLIDTNILLRSTDDIPSLSKDVLQIIEDPENRIYVSTVSIQEIFVLMQDEKIHVPAWKSAKDVFSFLESSGIYIGYVKKEHLLTFFDLLPVKKHRDPSDRMIIAQAITERMPLISSDNKFKPYCRQRLDFIPNKI